MIYNNINDMLVPFRIVDLYYHPTKKTEIYAGKGLLIDNQIRYTYINGHMFYDNRIVHMSIKNTTKFQFVYGYVDNLLTYFSSNYISKERIKLCGHQFSYGVEIINSYSKRSKPKAYLILWYHLSDDAGVETPIPIRFNIDFFTIDVCDIFVSYIAKEIMFWENINHAQITKTLNGISTCISIPTNNDFIEDMYSYLPYKIKTLLQKRYPTKTVFEHLITFSSIAHKHWEKDSYELAVKRSSEINKDIVGRFL